MKLHPEELELARAYASIRDFEGLTSDQARLVMERGRALHHWFKQRPVSHNLISAAVILFVFASDAFVLLGLPSLVLAEGRSDDLRWVVLASLIAGGAHSWLMYSLTVYSLHEGAAHNLIFVGSGPLARAGQFAARHMCRLAAAEPEQYAACHMSHHAKFGAEEDSEFLNFVMPRRYWMSLLPLAAFINVTDFLVHRPMTYTRSRVISDLASSAYYLACIYLTYRFFGLTFTILAMGVVAPHVGFYVDRLRQFTEHNLMPLENRNGARNFGVGFWGLFVGGGPWGQPCHLAHHLVPSLPWYQQIVLHFHIKRLLTPRQRRQFLVTPVIGFPRLWWRIIRDANRFARDQRARDLHAGSARPV
jgi:hypothetical protein